MNYDKNPLASAIMQRNAAKAAALLKLLANANRLRVLCSLADGEKTVGELAKIAGLSQSALSQHLTLLRQDGLLEADKRGQKMYYRLCSMEAKALLAVLFVMFCKS